MNIFKVFVSKNSKSITKRYSYWRVRLFYSMYLGYVVYYFTRSSFKILDIFFIKEGILTKEMHGFILAAAGMAYAISKFLSGILTDLTSPRILMFLGLLISGIINIILPGQSSFVVLLSLWTFNGLSQGLGWPPVAKMLTKWYTKKERGSWWGFWSTSHNVGEFLMPLIAVLAINNWRLSLYIPGIIAIFVSFFLLERLRSSPEDVNLPEVSKFMKDNSETESFVKVESSFATTLVKHVFKNPYVWSLIGASMFVYFVRGAMSPWLSRLMIKNGYSYSKSIFAISIFEFGGIFGSFASGFISDRFFSGKRSLVNIMFSFGILIFSYLAWISMSNYYLLITFVTILGFCVYGPQMLVGIAIAEVSNKEAVSTSTGFAGLWSYLGMSFAHIIIPNFSESSFFLSLIISGFFAMMFFVPLLSLDYFKKER